jgi:acetylornithine deacetylase/succinyl-diaminopimelate desuccinylase-like protein
VGAEEGKWKYPPFSGEIAEDCIWGRGAVDMKSMVIYELMALILIARRKIELTHDLILSVVADEEEGGNYGMKWMAEKHPHLMRSEYSFNEVGGFSIEAGKKRIYPIQVAQKGALWLKITVEGTPGHGSMPGSQNPVLKISSILERLKKPFPITPHPVSKMFLNSLGSASGAVSGFILRLLTVPYLGEFVLNKIIPVAKRPYLSALLRNTITPTGLCGSNKTNVIPSSASIILDCRSLPGMDHKTFLKEILKKIAEDVQVEILHDLESYEVKDWNTSIFQKIKTSIEKNDPSAVVTPSLTVGFTDAKHLESIGVKTYGFFPMKLPSGFEFGKLFHGHNERIPVESFQWGLRVFFETVMGVMQE